MGHSGPLYLYFCLFNTVDSIQLFNKFCWWLDLNCGPLVLEATTLPTEPQPLPLIFKRFSKSFFFKMGHPWPLFHLFLVFSNKQYNFLTTIKCLKCPSSKRCSDSNSRTPECQSPPITTWPVLLHQQLLRKA